MPTQILIVVIAGFLLTLGLLLVLLSRVKQAETKGIAQRLDSLERSLERTERTMRDEAAVSREEQSKESRDQRKEIAETFRTFSDSVAQRLTEVTGFQKTQLDGFSSHLTSFANASGERLDGVRAESATGAKQLREEVVASLKSIADTISTTLRDLSNAEKTQLEKFSEEIAALTRTSNEKLDSIRTESAAASNQLREEVIRALTAIIDTTTRTMGEIAEIQKARLDAMSAAIGALTESNEKKLEAVRATVEGKLQFLQSENSKQLEQMRLTVDEKLQGTLEKRLGESFKLVSERLELVHKGLGEMQTLATGVGDLKKVLTNVKTRGTWGEVQLGALLEQVLTPEQFATNVATKEGNDRVEYAIRLPGQSTDPGSTVWLPIDAKFPIEDYQRLVDAQERANISGVEEAARQLEVRVKACASDINAKYLNPPKTTDFAILFLPIEGLFAEVVRRTSLAQLLQREYRVMLAGPTTLWSILNSLQMGFRTLAIQKRSSEVWNLLAAVKTEWMKYGDVLDLVQKKLDSASDTVEKARVRSRAIGRNLKEVEALPVDQVATFFPEVSANANESAEVEDAE